MHQGGRKGVTGPLFRAGADALRRVFYKTRILVLCPKFTLGSSARVCENGTYIFLMGRKVVVSRVWQLAHFGKCRDAEFPEATRELRLASEAHADQRHPVSLHL